jgi:hypothetical protein
MLYALLLEYFLHKVSVEEMRVDTVAEVVHEASQHHILLVLLGYQHGLIVASARFLVPPGGVFQVGHHLLSDVCDTERVTISVVDCTREHVI